MKVTLYTDGAARGNPDGPGGYGAVLQFVDKEGTLHEKELSAGYVKTTNNRMELMAAIAGLEALNRPCEVELYSDSRYLVDAFNQKWIDGWVKHGWNRPKSGPVKNSDLWKRLLKAMEPHVPTQNHFFAQLGLPGLFHNYHGIVLGVSAGRGQGLYHVAA